MSRDYDDHDLSLRARTTHAPSGSPGRTTRTERLSPSVHSIARALAAELRAPTAPVQAKGELALDSAEVHALAAHGTAGIGGSLPFLDQIQRAFGRHDVSGVTAHVGGAAAEAAQAMGARAYASGNQVAFAREPDLFLAAHEAAHVVQQRSGVQLSGGVGRSGDVYEQHADEVAAAVVEGRSAAELLDRYAGTGSGGAGAPAVQRDDEDDEERLPHRVRRAMREDRHRAGREEEQDVYLDTDIGVVDAEGAPVRRHVGGGDSPGRTDLGRGSSVRGGTQRTRVVRDGETELHDEVDEEVRTLTQTTRREGRQVQGHDAAAMAADMKAQLEYERGLLQQAARRERDPERRAELEREVEDLGWDIERLGQVRPGDDLRTVREIARRRRMLVAPQYRARSGDLSTRETGLDPNAEAGTVRLRDRVAATSTQDDVTLTAVSETRREANLGDRTVEVGRREEREVRAGEVRGRRVSDRSTRVTVDDGVRVRQRREERHMRTDTEGTEHERSTVHERRRGIVADENGWGVTTGGTRRETHRLGDQEVSTESGGDVTIRENSIGGERTAGTTIRDGNASFGTKVSADGSFTIDIQRENNETPPRYRLVFTIHVGADVGLTLDREDRERRRGVRAGAHARASGSGDLVLRRTLTEEQARQYWSEADRAERDRNAAGRSSLPEFQRLARIRAGFDNADQLANARAIAGDASAAREMSDGEETELTLRGDVNVGGNLGHRGQGHDIGIEAETEHEWTRRVRVQRIGSGDTSRVRVTVTYEHAGRWHVEGEASAGGSPTVGLRRGGGSGDGDTYRFTLNPNSPTFDEHYAAIVRTTNRDELRALAENPAYQQEVDYREHRETEESEGSEQVSQGGLRVAMQRRGRYEERVRRRDDALSGEARGSQDTSMEIGGSDDMVLARGGHEGSAHAVVERDGQMDVTLEHREHATDPVRAAREDREANARADTEERLRNAVRETPRERLRRILSTEYSRLRGYYLDEGDIETIVQRAADRSQWEACASSPRMFQSWRRLRVQLRSPNVRSDEAEIDREVARKLAIARHIARFYQEHGRYAQTAMENVLRNWGAAGLSGIVRDSRAARVGAEYEWPHALRSRKTEFESIRAEVRDLERAAAGRATEGDASEDSEDQRYARALSLHEQLTGIYTAVQQSRDFESEGARASLLREIDDYRTRLRRLRVSHREQSRSSRELAREGRQPDQLDRMMQEARTDIEVARASIHTIVQRLRGYKRREQAELRRANQLSYSTSGIPEAVRICGELHDMALVWYRDVQALRQAYETAGVPREEWEVSERGGTRSRTLEPEMGWLIEIYLRCHAGNPIDNGRTRAAQWREEFRSY